MVRALELMKAKLRLLKIGLCPKNVKDIKSFLGLANYYRRYLYNFAKRAGPLNNLLRKGTIFRWDQKCQESFDDIRISLTKTPVLVHADLTKSFILTTDASMESIGYVLSQLGPDGKEHPISFSGRSLRKSERNYSVTEKEGLALISGVKEFYPYLVGNHFTIVTDHLSLAYLKSIKYGTGRLFRWSLALQDLQYTVQYKKGNLFLNPDYKMVPFILIPSDITKKL